MIVLPDPRPDDATLGRQGGYVTILGDAPDGDAISAGRRDRRTMRDDQALIQNLLQAGGSTCRTETSEKALPAKSRQKRQWQMKRVTGRRRVVKETLPQPQAP